MKKILSVLLVALFWSCKDNNETPDSTDFTEILETTTDVVIIPTYEDLYSKTVNLESSLNLLLLNPTDDNLALARQAWREARIPWERSEGFLFGPVETLGIDPSIDSWPVNQADLDAVLNSNDALTKTYIDAQEGTLKGFHTLEYLLFGANGNKMAADFTTRQFEYLLACSQSLEGACKNLRDNWKGSTANFAVVFKTAGEPGNQIYPSQKSAVQETINGLVTIADEVANGKIFEPYSQQNLLFEESRFSANSKADFADNIRSIQNVYAGTYENNSGAGISKLVAEKNPALDARVIQQIQDAITAINDIDGTFSSAIFNAKPSVENAQNKVRLLQETLQNEVYPLLDQF